MCSGCWDERVPATEAVVDGLGVGSSETGSSAFATAGAVACGSGAGTSFFAGTGGFVSSEAGGDFAALLS